MPTISRSAAPGSPREKKKIAGGHARVIVEAQMRFGVFSKL